LLLALCQAYLARKVSTDLQESNYIFITMALILLVAFIAVPVVIISKENRTVSYFIRASVIFVICTSVLVLIYVPKWKAFNKRIKNQKLGLVRQRSSFSEDQGINILWSPKDQIEVEDQNKGLLEQNKGLLEQNEKLLKEIEKWKNSEEIKAQTGLSNINMLSVQDKVCES
jgi:Na+/melibiose symporter-like transporter